ncbi:putative spore protein YtfJ [Anaerobacterium chartisolvens]|uniref:Putative spore protein YtfJ n=1 Tax=Anaerobacterium chartisolvens TaxID=1297424 RepID=A0A369B4W8_9FIRM|nr:spore germination protein GerW family protein [Anaerobacterium chartisolvens]RCX16572.1 putative spore protein YtfJ [Anaerobacterium chartisolvens]
MASTFSVSENINIIFEKIENFLKTKTVVGEPMKIGETTIVPFINVSFGMGSGGGDGIDEKGVGGGGGGAGMGARVSPTAVLIIQGDRTELIPIKKSGGLEKLLEMVPDIVEKINDKKCCE